MHEVVVRNRLEQLRKRQRDEALHAQEELLAGVARAATRRAAEQPVETMTVEDNVPMEDVEPYDRSMSPVPINIARLHAEERQVAILTAAEDKRNLVRVFLLFQ